MINNKIKKIAVIIAFVLCLFSIGAVCLSAYYGDNYKHLFKISLPLSIIIIIWIIYKKDNVKH
jgi:K+-transporting ATPase A subunit